MITYKDCPECGAHKIRSTVRFCEVCETCEKYESKFNAQWADLERIASLCGRTADEHPLQAVARVVRERDEARASAEESEHQMHLRIRAGYDKTIADSWRAKVAEVEQERDEARAEVERLRERNDYMREALISRMENWRKYAETEVKNGHYGTAANAQLQAAELQFVVDQWLIKRGRSEP